MNIDLETYIGSPPSYSNTKFKLSLPAFMKHAAIAGQGKLNKGFPRFLKALGVLLFYKEYLKLDCGVLQGFNHPSNGDPTEVGQFSNVAGKAVADLLAKKYAGAIHTITYEAAMKQNGNTIIGPRPDFYCLTATGAFALEAKGRSGKASDDKMKTWKTQAASGPLAVSRGYASAFHSIFQDAPGCRFHDPIVDGYIRNEDLDLRLAYNFYSTFLEGIDIGGQIPLNGETYEIIGGTVALRDFEFTFILEQSVATAYREGNARKLLQGITPNSQNSGILEDRQLYIDRDGIGILIK